jgi:hypothetical protein
VPLTTRFWSVVVDPVIVTVPGKVAVMPDRPTVMPVAEEAPIVMVPVASMIVPESPVILVPVKVSDANAKETPTTAEIKKTEATNAVRFLACFDLGDIEGKELVEEGDFCC